ncbi:co-chaperone GroES [Candidatus Parcubacteria bacterium]|nr:MAG: co-chaperone GroES [Candidatus Parcubacteria bacterium]
MNIKPIGDRLLVKPIKEEEVTASGIVLPDTVDKEKKAEGEIVVLGNGEKLEKLGLSVGQKVLYKKWGGEDVQVGGEEYKILTCDTKHEKGDLLAIVE